MLSDIITPDLFASAIRMATPLALAAIGGTICERSGRREHRARRHDALRRVHGGGRDHVPTATRGSVFWSRSPLADCSR